MLGRYPPVKDDRNYKGTALFPYPKKKRWERRRNEKILALSVSISRRWTRSICSTFPQPSRPAIDRIPGTRSKTSWKNSAGILTAAERGFGGSSNDWNKNPLPRFLPLDTRHAFASPLLDKYCPFKMIFLCCFGIDFFLHHSWMWVQTEIRSMVIFIYCFLKLKNSRVNRNFLKCFFKIFFFYSTLHWKYNLWIWYIRTILKLFK